MKTVTRLIEIENADIRFKNFQGAAGKYNNAGNRNFSVFLTNEMADELMAEGWNVKCLLPVDDETPPQCHLRVDVGFKVGTKPPKVVMITSAGKRFLDADTVEILDYADIETVDLILNPYNYEVNGKTGVKAYLKDIYVTIRENVFDKKYADIPDSGAGAIGSTDMDFYGED